MLAWFVDNANLIYIVLGFIALGLGVSWWLNRRVRTLILIAGVAALIALFWLFTLLVPTDRKQITANVWAMRQAVLDRKSDELARHWAQELTFQNFSRDDLARAVTKAAADFQVNDIHLWDFDVRSVTDSKADIWFRCRVTGRDGAPFLALCNAAFVKEGEAWKLSNVDFFNPVVNANQKIQLPIGR